MSNNEESSAWLACSGSSVSGPNLEVGEVENEKMKRRESKDGKCKRQKDKRRRLYGRR